MSQNPAKPALPTEQRKSASEFFAQAQNRARTGQFQLALPLYRHALQLNPEHIGALHGLANALLALQHYPQLQKVLTTLKQLAPEHIQTRFIDANLLINRNQDEQASALLTGLLNEAPQHYAAHIALAHLYLKAHEPKKAELLLNKARMLPHRDTSLYVNLGTALNMQGKFAAEQLAYEAGLEIKPNNTALKNNLAYVLLRNQEFAQGWLLYEARYRYIAKLGTPPATCKRWQGESLQGKSILVLDEQGFGDMLFSAGYLAALHATGATIHVECRKLLRTLLGSHAHIAQLVDTGSTLPNTDYYVPAMSLPGLLGDGTHQVFSLTPYLHPSAQSVTAWKHQLAQQSGFRIGIAWQGRENYGLDHLRSIPLMAFAPLIQDTGASLVSVQKGAPGKDQIHEFELFFSLVDVDRLSDKDRDFHDTAAIIANLDLVICSDTSVAHLAGAMGAPVWVVLSDVADWRWFENTASSRWYPSMRLFRKKQGESWHQTMLRVRAALLLHIQSRSSGDQL